MRLYREEVLPALLYPLIPLVSGEVVPMHIMEEIGMVDLEGRAYKHSKIIRCFGLVLSTMVEYLIRCMLESTSKRSWNADLCSTAQIIQEHLLWNERNESWKQQTEAEINVMYLSCGSLEDIICSNVAMYNLHLMVQNFQNRNPDQQMWRALRGQTAVPLAMQYPAAVPNSTVCLSTQPLSMQSAHQQERAKNSPREAKKVEVC